MSSSIHTEKRVSLIQVILAVQKATIVKEEYLIDRTTKKTHLRGFVDLGESLLYIVGDCPMIGRPVGFLLRLSSSTHRGK